MFLPYCFLTLLSPLPAAQVGGGTETHLELLGQAEGDRLGQAACSLGDVNGDSVPDFAVSAWMKDLPGRVEAGVVYVVSGVDGSRIRSMRGSSQREWFGFALANAGDHDIDGIDDLYVGVPRADHASMRDAGSVLLFSGADGSLLRKWKGTQAGERFGSSIALLEDMNGDHRPDLLVGAPSASSTGASGHGRAYAFSGLTGQELYRWSGTHEFEALGISVNSPGDVNQDGYSDVLISAPNAHRVGLDDVGFVSLYSGIDGQLMTTFEGQAAYERFGGSVGRVGDLNLDGIPEIAIGSPAFAMGGIPYFGRLQVFSGADYSIMHTLLPESEIFHFGKTIEPVEDMDGDGHPDILTSTAYARPGDMALAGSALLYSGRDGRLLARWDGEEAGSYLGTCFSSAGDLDGDGFPELLIGASASSLAGPDDSGVLWVDSWSPYLRSSAFEVSDTAASLVILEVDFPQVAANWEYEILLSMHGIGPVSYGVEVPLAMDNLFVQSIQGQYPFPISSGLQGILDASGQALVTLGKLSGQSTGALGRTLQVAAVAHPQGQLPQISSVAIPITITP